MNVQRTRGAGCQGSRCTVRAFTQGYSWLPWAHKLYTEHDLHTGVLNAEGPAAWGVRLSSDIANDLLERLHLSLDKAACKLKANNSSSFVRMLYFYCRPPVSMPTEVLLAHEGR